MGVYANSEPLISDVRLARIEDALRKHYPGQLDRTTFITARVEAPEGHPDEAHFLMFTPDPRRNPLAMELVNWGTTARILLSEWDKDEKEASHLVGAPDTATRVFALVAKTHLEELKNRAEMDPDPIESYFPDET